MSNIKVISVENITEKFPLNYTTLKTSEYGNKS